MTYYLGVDLGTTYTSAAVLRDDSVRIVELGTHGASIPSLVFLTEDEEVLTGEPAGRRGSTAPDRLAREFKRRFGDTTPLLLGGSPWSADALMARVLRQVTELVAIREGGAPAGVAITHPANWGSYKRDLLDQSVRNADLVAVTLTEPVAAVVHYASQSRIDVGSVVAVYDLGGGTFDAAVVRKTGDTEYEILGDPEGVERLGGIDFDEAVFAHVVGSLGDAVGELDAEDPVVQQAVARLREECVTAKEALSADTEVSIPVLLPGLATEVRLTRAEFESMIRPPLQDSIRALERALRNAGVGTDELSAVLLAGGSSRIPLVAQLVSAELGKPVAVDAHPKHGVAMGAARWAATHAATVTEPSPAVTPPVTEPSPAVTPPVTEPSPAVTPPVTEPSPAMTPPVTTEAPVVAEAPVTADDPEVAPAIGEPPQPEDRKGRSRMPLLVGVIVVAFALAAGIAMALGGGDDTTEDDTAGDDTADDDTAESTTTSTSTTSTTTTSSTTIPTVDEPTPTEGVLCEGLAELCIEIVEVTLDSNGELVLEWESDRFVPRIDGNHAHFFLSSVRPTEAGVQGNGVWEVSDTSPHVAGTNGDAITLAGGRAQNPDADICVTVAEPDHTVRDAAIYQCWPIPES